ncbi:MAG: TonB-dependent receptor plug domain-containing protein [Paludibacter sp.]|nr:TonB-dependent receptor plug domain-containing protein [Paludibacter sp.]
MLSLDFWMNKCRFGMLVFLCIWLFADALHALEKLDTAKVYAISEVTVTEQYRKSEIRSTAPFQMLSSKQINKLNVLNVADAVKYFSGVSVKDYGGIGGLKTVSVRSLGANHTAVSYDGITLTDCQTGQIDIGRFSLDHVDMLSLSNGQSDNIFQPARLFASAALLHIKTLSPKFEGDKTLNGKISFKGGSFGLINPAFWLQQKINQKLSLTLGGEWLSAQGQYPYLLEYSYLGTGMTSTETRKNTDVQNLRLEGALYANLSEHESAYIKTYYYASERGLPGATILYNTDNFSSQRMRDRTFFVQGKYEKDYSRLLSMQINAKYHHGFLHYLDTTYLNDIGKMESFYRQNEYYTSFSFLYRCFDNVSLSFSTDGFINNIFADFETDALNDAFAQPTRYSLLSVLAVKYLSNQFLTTGSLLSTIVNEQVKVGDAATNYRRLSPYVSISYKPFVDEDFRFRFFYKNIFRLPSFNDLYYSRIGNAGLRPETTNQYNLGMTYAYSAGNWLPLFSVTVDAYRNYVKDKIVALPTKNIFVWSMVNLGNVQIDGVDLTMETSVFMSDKTALVLGATYTYQRALDVTNPESSTYKHQIPYTPRISGSGRIGVETPWIDLSYSLLWSGHRYAGFQNYAENRLPGYADHGISISQDYYIQNKVLSVNIEMLNILDENYAIVKWFPMPGRSLRATVGLKF